MKNYKITCPNQRRKWVLCHQTQRIVNNNVHCSCCRTQENKVVLLFHVMKFQKSSVVVRKSRGVFDCIRVVIHGQTNRS